MHGKQNKKTILTLRWTAIIVTSYLILFGQGKVTSANLGHLLIMLYILSNIVLTFVATPWFSKGRFYYSLIVVDTLIVSIGMYLSEQVTTDFYIVFFLILILVSLSRNYKLLLAISGIIASLYGILLYSWGFFNTSYGISYFLRIPFVLIMAAFYGHLLQTFSKETQQALALSEDKYRGLFENAYEGIIILKGNQLSIVDVNREAERLTGYKKEELLKKNCVDLFRPDDKEMVAQPFDEIFKKGEVRTDAYSLIRNGDGLCNVDLSIKRIPLGDEDLLQLMFRDLTEQRKLERRIRQSKRDLEAIFDGIQDQFSIRAPDYRILRVNRAVIEKYNTTFQGIIGKKCYEVYYDRNVPCEKCPVTITLNTKQPASVIQKNAVIDSTLHIFSYPILDENGNVSSVIEYSRDITEEQRLQDQLIQSEKLAGIGILASGVAHEINNPLSGILGMTELLLEEENSEEKKAYLNDMLDCSRRIGEIVGGLRSYSRTAKKAELSLVNLNEILEDSVKMVKLASKTAPVEIVRNFQSVLKVKAIPGEIQQVFTNLITNGFQAMKGKEGALGLSTRMLRDSVEARVSDTGTGIPQKHLNKIFDPFFTTKGPEWRERD